MPAMSDRGGFVKRCLRTTNVLVLSGARGRKAATRAVYWRCVEMDTERKRIFCAWVDQALHAREQDWRSLRSGEDVLARSRIRRRISMGSCDADITGS